MNKNTHTAEQSAAGAAAPEKHKITYVTRSGGSVVLPAPEVTGNDSETDHNTIAESELTEDSTHA